MEIAEFVGIKILKVLYMENTNMFTFKHPKYYKELRARNKSDQAISKDASTEATSVRPDPGLKQQAASDSQVVNQVKLSSQSQASSAKLREK